MAVIQNDRDIALQASPYRLSDTTVTITSTGSVFNTAKNGGSTTPSSITLTATTNNVFTAACVKTWHYSLNTSPTVWVSLGTGNTKVITNSNILSIIGSATSINYRCTVTENLLNTAYDFYTVTYVKEVSDPIVVSMTRTAVPIKCSYAGIPFNYENTDTVITVSRGTTVYTYAASGANTFSVTPVSTGVTFSASTTTTSYNVANITAVSADSTKLTFTIVVRDESGVAVSPNYTKETTYTKIYTGSVGSPGTKSVIINAFKWSNSGIGSYTQAFTYTWSSGTISAYPSGFTLSAPASPGAGYTLYQLALTITDAVAASTTSSINWSSAVANTVGYRSDGSIGPQGGSNRTAYLVSKSNTPPVLVISGVGDVVPTSAEGTWSFTSTSSLPAGSSMYQVDGILNGVSGNIDWMTPYLSTIKVGSLSSISADLGTVSISPIGSLSTTGKTYGSATPGVFLGYSGAAYKFDIGNSTNYLRWDGTNLSMTGAINATSGNFTGTITGSTITGNTINGGTVNGTTVNSSVLNSATINSGAISLQGDGGTGWGYARSSGKWWSDGLNGWILARAGSTGDTFAEVKAGDCKIWVSSFAGAEASGITFPGIRMTDQGLTISQINVINTLNVAGYAITTPLSASGSSGYVNTYTLTSATDSFPTGFVTLICPVDLNIRWPESSGWAGGNLTVSLRRNGSIIQSKIYSFDSKSGGGSVSYSYERRDLVLCVQDTPAGSAYYQITATIDHVNFSIVSAVITCIGSKK